MDFPPSPAHSSDDILAGPTARDRQVHFSDEGDKEKDEEENDDEAERGPSPSLPRPRRMTRHTARKAQELNIKAPMTAGGSSITGALRNMKVAAHTRQKTKEREERSKKRSHHTSEDEEEAPKAQGKRKNGGASTKVVGRAQGDSDESEGETVPTIRRSPRKVGKAQRPRPTKGRGRR